LLVIALYDIAFIATKESLPSWRLTFLLVTNQLSLNTKSSKSSLLTTATVVDAEQMVAIEVSKYEVILEMVDFWLYGHYAPKIATWIAPVICIMRQSILIPLVTCPTLSVVCPFYPIEMRYFAH
jgi:hypothetical protein